MAKKVSIADIEKYLDFIQSDSEEAHKERDQFAKALKRDQQRAKRRGDDPFGFYSAIRIK